MSEEILYLPKILFKQRPSARAQISGGARNPDITGEVLVYPFQRGSLLITAVKNLPSNGFYGFHIHENGECSGDFTSAGSHYNPTNAPHPMHAGDLPNLLSNDGFAYMMVYTNRVKPQEVIGRAFIIHDMPDDYRTQPAGDAGARIACGVIVRA